LPAFFADAEGGADEVAELEAVVVVAIVVAVVVVFVVVVVVVVAVVVVVVAVVVVVVVVDFKDAVAFVSATALELDDDDGAMGEEDSGE